MERRPRSRAQLATALLTAAFWAGCAWGPAPVDHFYALEPGAPSVRAAKPLSGTLQVDRLRSSAMVGERNVLYRKDGNASEINRHSYHRWSDPPTILLQTELVAHLKAAGAADTVMAATARVKADYVVSGRLQHFERVLEPQPHALVELDLMLTDAKGEVLVHGSYREEQIAAASTVAASADAFGQAVHAAMDRFVADFP